MNESSCVELNGEFYELVEKDEVIYVVSHEEYPEIPEDIWDHNLPCLDMRNPGEILVENMDSDLEKVVREFLKV